MVKNMQLKLLAGIATATGAAASHAAAAPIDVTEVVTFIDGLLAPIALIGGAYLIVAYAIKGWRLMRSV